MLTVYRFKFHRQWNRPHDVVGDDIGDAVYRVTYAEFSLTFSAPHSREMCLKCLYYRHASA